MVTMDTRPSSAAMEPEFEVGIWRRSTVTWGFWWRTLTTFGLYYLFLWPRNYVKLTNRRVTRKRGELLGGEERSIGLENITDIFVDIPPMGALLNWGHIHIQTAGSSAVELAFYGLDNAKQLREMIYDLKDGQLDETY
ncbi:MAG: hypothetical protein OHK0046_28920 [Anaerolineae bacterium]